MELSWPGFNGGRSGDFFFFFSRRFGTNMTAFSGKTYHQKQMQSYLMVQIHLMHSDGLEERERGTLKRRQDIFGELGATGPNTHGLLHIIRRDILDKVIRDAREASEMFESVRT
jgi:hypothetical protein